MTRKDIFDSIREARNKGFDAREVATIDAFLDTLGVPRPSIMKASLRCVKLVQDSESCKLKAYPDPASGGEPWTVGWGHTGPDVGPGTMWTQERADAALAADLGVFTDGVLRLTKGRVTQGQLDALVSFSYNEGLKKLGGSTLLALHNEGRFDEAAKEFDKWVYADGKKMSGLITRRAKEEVLYKS